MKPPEDFPLPWKPYDVQGIQDSSAHIVAYCDALRNGCLRDYAVHAANNYPRAIELLKESRNLRAEETTSWHIPDLIEEFLESVGEGQ